MGRALIWTFLHHESLETVSDLVMRTMSLQIGIAYSTDTLVRLVSNSARQAGKKSDVILDCRRQSSLLAQHQCFVVNADVVRCRQSPPTTTALSLTSKDLEMKNGTMVKAYRFGAGLCVRTGPVALALERPEYEYLAETLTGSPWTGDNNTFRRGGSQAL
jgi:hypothetical protein